MGRKWSDNFVTNLASTITNSSTSLSVTAGTGTFAPAVTGKGTPGAALDFLVLTLEDSAGNIEKIKCEAHTLASDTFGSGGFPLIRGYDGTTAAAWTAGTTVMVEIRVDKSFLQNADSKLLSVDPAIAFGYKDSASSGLNFGYYGGQVIVDGVLTTIVDGSLALTASQVNYIERTGAGVISANIVGFTANRYPMYEVTTNATDVTVIQDRRTSNFRQWGRAVHALSGGEIAAGTANATAAEARNWIIEVTGALTQNTTFILPQINIPFCVKNSTSGAFSLTFKGATGAGVAVTQGFANQIFFDGVNFVSSVNDPSLFSSFSTGDVKITLKTVADSGWVMFDDGTIGNLLSGATTRANADTINLYSLLWTSTADAQCPVSTGRGASAAADFAANKTIALPKSLGRALAVSGAGAGLTSRALALAMGDENLQAHTHTGTTGGQSVGHTHTTTAIQQGGGSNVNANPGVSITGNFGITSSGTSNDHTHSFTTASTGAGGSQNMQPSIFMNIMVKL